jgi:hypothetical protein
VQPADVLVDGRWYPARLERWKLGPSGWRGYVWWTVGVGLQHVGWVPAERLRAAR